MLENPRSFGEIQHILRFDPDLSAAVSSQFWVFGSQSMSAEGVDLKKRRFLTVTTAVVGAVGAGFAAVPFIASWNPSERAKALGAPEEADISKLEPGGLLRLKRGGIAAFVQHRAR